MPSLEILQEGERRGLLNDQQKSLLAEARRRGIGETPPPSFMQKGGFVDRNLLSGQIPLAGTIAGGVAGGMLGLPVPVAGSALGGVAGAGLVGAGAQNLQDSLRQLLKFDPPKSIGQNFQSAGIGGLKGATSEAVGQSLGAILSMIGSGASGLAKSGVRKLATPAFKQPIEEIQKSILEKTPTLGEEAVQRGVVGFRQKALDIAKGKLSDFGSKLDSLLMQASDSSVDPFAVIKELDPVKQKFIQEGNKAALRQIERKEAAFVAQHLGSNDFVFKTADELAQQGSILKPFEAKVIKKLNQNIAKYGASTFETQATGKEFSKAIARGLRKEIERIVPEASYLENELRVYGQLTDSLSESLARDLTKGGINIPLTTAGAAAPGIAIGNAPLAAAGAAAVQATKSFPVRTLLASQLQKVANGATPEVGALLSNPSLKRAIFKVLGSESVFKTLQNGEN